MKLSLKLKTGLFLVLFVAWFFVLNFTASSADEVSALSKKQFRNVVMLDAWSYSSGNSRDGYEGRFVDEESGVNFTYTIPAHVYSAYSKRLTPEAMVLKLTTAELEGKNVDALLLGVVFMSVALIFSACVFIAFQFAFFKYKRGMIYDWYMYIRSKK